MSDGTCRLCSNSPNNVDVMSGFAEPPTLVGAKVTIEGLGCVGISLISRFPCDVGMVMADDHVGAVDQAPGGPPQVSPHVVLIPVGHERGGEPAERRHDRRADDNSLGDVIAAQVIG